MDGQTSGNSSLCPTEDLPFGAAAQKEGDKENNYECVRWSAVPATPLLALDRVW